MDSATEKTAYKILLASGLAPREELEKIWKQAESSQGSFCETLARSGLASEEAVLEAFSKATGTLRVHLKSLEIDKGIFLKVPVKFATYYKFFPFKIQDGKLWIAVSGLRDIRTLDEIRLGLGFEIQIALAPEPDIQEMLKKYYGVGADTVDRILSQSGGHPSAPAPVMIQEVQDLEKGTDAASVSQLVNQILLEAYKKGASDIHLEPLRNGIRIRYRIDGVLHETPVPPELKKFFPAIVSRIKVLANLNVVEKRLPQDGKMRVKTQEQTLDLRISSVPTPHGESLVIRILPGQNIWALEKLGFEPPALKAFKSLLERPNGILFVTGPTGSGKSTTLYGALNALNQRERKIITLEDPVEYELEGITQIQVTPEIGLSFSQGLRSVLRHDPDVLMVGEVRDLETADIAIRAALTGHLILSTLHTNDAASGITRLLDIGVEPYLVASSVIAFMAQRLVRVLCPDCRQEDLKMPPETRAMILGRMGADAGSPKVRFYAPGGCERCSGTGFKGRLAIHEMLVLDETLRELILSRVSSETIKARAMQLGMVTLRQSGWEKVLKGITSAGEILKVAPADPQDVPPAPAAGPQKVIAVTGGGVFEESRHEPEAAPKEKPAGPPPPEPVQAEAAVGHEEQAAHHGEKPENDYSNRRKYPRVNVQLPLTFRIVDYQGVNPAILKFKEHLSQISFDASTEDISAGGLSMICPDAKLPGITIKGVPEPKLGMCLESGNSLELLIELPNDPKPVECMARALRVMRLVETSIQGETRFFYKVGILFLIINSPDRQRIERFCLQTKAHETV